MKKNLSYLLLLIVCINLNLKGQNVQSADTSMHFEKAKYIAGDLIQALSKKMNYPIEALQSSIEGDVVISGIIDKMGKLTDLQVVNSSDKTLSTSSLFSVTTLENRWIPCKVEGEPIDKKYLFVFRFRILDSQPPDYIKRVEDLMKQQKFEKSLKVLKTAIKDNKFEYKLFALRSEAKAALNDSIGAKEDLHQAKIIQDEVIAVINIIGYCQVMKRTEVREVSNERSMR